MNEKVLYAVAVYWPKDGTYGGKFYFSSMDKANVEAEHLQRLGYGKQHNPIRIIRCTEDEVVKEISDG